MNRVEEFVRLLREQLFDAFFKWLEVNKDKIGAEASKPPKEKPKEEPFSLMNYRKGIVPTLPKEGWHTKINAKKAASWYNRLYTEGKKAYDTCDSPGKIMGCGLWMFNMIADLGVGAGLGINEYHLQFLAPGVKMAQKPTFNLADVPHGILRSF